MSVERFSQRYGHGPEERKITIREDATQEVREAILAIAHGELSIRPTVLRTVLCTVLRKLPDPSNWSEYPNIWAECQYLINDCPWYRVYDFAEALHHHLIGPHDTERARHWEKLLNEYFIEAGVGWRMVDGLLESRGPEAFEVAVDRARQSLAEVGLSTARQEIHESLRDLSRRPEADLTGAVQHAMAALECTAREVVNDQRSTLGEVLRRYSGVLPKPLDEAIVKMWGYASETGRHLREGRMPTRAEAELIVGVSAATCVYFAAKIGTE